MHARALTGEPTVAGAIFGVGGAMAVFFYRHRGYFGERGDAILGQLGQALAINTVIGILTPQVDQWCVLIAERPPCKREEVCAFTSVSPRTRFRQASICVLMRGGGGAVACASHEHVLPCTCRGHFSGLLGGAAVAWALGPRYVEVKGPPSRSAQQPPECCCGAQVDVAVRRQSAHVSFADACMLGCRWNRPGASH